MDGRSLMKTPAAVLAAGAVLTGCGSPGTAAPTSGPVQRLTLVGADGAFVWGASDDRTECTWGGTVWRARIEGDAAGHHLVLTLKAPGPVPQTGTHDLPDPAAGQQAVLDVDGTAYSGVFIDPGDAVPSYFTLDPGGYSGEISVRFAADSLSPQAWLLSGIWRCGE